MNQNDQLVNTALYLYGKLVYKKLKNRYRIYCMKCGRYEYVSYEQFKQIQAAQVCPMCYEKVKLSRVPEHQFRYYIMDEDNDGFRVTVDYRFGCKPKANLTHVMYDAMDGQNVYTRFIVPGMGGCSFCWWDDLDNWKKRHAQGYFWRFYSLHEPEKISGKKEYIYRALWDVGMKNDEADRKVKSNQKKIFMDNLMNGRQMEFVIAFDLKSYDEVYRYRAYMKNNSPNTDRILNVHYLDYLHRNRVKLRDFYDYWDQCNLLNYKLDKPKDFQNRHYHYGETIQQKKNKLNEEGIKRRYQELMEKAYGSGKISIKPFSSGKEIRECARQLHNCIASIYLPKYAMKETDLYYLAVGKKMAVAIEVRKGELLQARTNWNNKCPANLMKHIRKWCKDNEFTIGDRL